MKSKYYIKKKEITTFDNDLEKEITFIKYIVFKECYVFNIRIKGLDFYHRSFKSRKGAENYIKYATKYFE